MDDAGAAARRYRTLLISQGSALSEYLEVLENQRQAILRDDGDALEVYADMGEGLAAAIESTGKALKSLEALGVPEDGEISRLRTDLRDIEARALERNGENRKLLLDRMAGIRQRLGTLQNPYRNRRSVFSQDGPVATVIKIDV
ncbi:MAG: flagellar protein FlgN [Spirochaetaceae bacterium]|nr:flagellar protein FlgN [Spirochaetaceae bacterium]